MNILIIVNYYKFPCFSNTNFKIPRLFQTNYFCMHLPLCSVAFNTPDICCMVYHSIEYGWMEEFLYSFFFFLRLFKYRKNGCQKTTPFVAPFINVGLFLSETSYKKIICRREKFSEIFSLKNVESCKAHPSKTTITITIMHFFGGTFFFFDRVPDSGNTVLSVVSNFVIFVNSS